MTPRLHKALGALCHRDFRLFYTALLGTAMGFQLHRTIELWLVYELTESALFLGLTGLVRGVPTFLFSLAGGVVADRVERRRFVIAVHSVNALITIALGLLALSGLIRVWHLYVAALVNSTLTAAGGPARTAMVPGVVPRQLLVNAFAHMSSARKLSQLIGPALGGLLLATVGAAGTYGVTCAIYAAAIYLMVRMRYETGPLDRKQSPLQSLLEGISFIRGNSLIGVLLVMEFVSVYFGSYRALLPIFAAALGLGPEGFGVLLSAPAFGSLLAVGVVMSVGDIRYKGLFIALSAITYGACMFGLALSQWFFLSVSAIFLLGFFDALQSVMRSVVIQSMTPDELRGRASSFQRMLGVGGPTLGEAQSGAVAALIGAPLTLVVTGTVCIGLTAGLVAARRDLRAQEFAEGRAVRVQRRESLAAPRHS